MYFPLRLWVTKTGVWHWWPHTLRNILRHLEGCLVSVSPKEEEEPVSCVCLCCGLGDVRHTLAAVCSVYIFRSSLCCPVYTSLLLAWPESVVSPVYLSHPKSRWCSKLSVAGCHSCGSLAGLAGSPSPFFMSLLLCKGTQLDLRAGVYHFLSSACWIWSYFGTALLVVYCAALKASIFLSSSWEWALVFLCLFALTYLRNFSILCYFSIPQIKTPMKGKIPL